MLGIEWLSDVDARKEIFGLVINAIADKRDAFGVPPWQLHIGANSSRRGRPGPFCFLDFEFSCRRFTTEHAPSLTDDKMRFFTSLPLVLLALISTVQAQFGFFDQMFGGQQQERKPQNVPSDSAAYRNQYDNCTQCFPDD